METLKLSKKLSLSLALCVFLGSIPVQAMNLNPITMIKSWLATKTQPKKQSFLSSLYSRKNISIATGIMAAAAFFGATYYFFTCSKNSRPSKNDHIDLPIDPPKPIHDAVQAKDIEEIKRLIKEGIASVNDRGYCNNTPLHELAYSEHNDKEKMIAIAALLLENNADINAQSHAGRTPLHVAIQEGKVELATFFIKNGANMNIQKFEYKTTPLHEAMRYRRKNSAILLIESGARTDIKDEEGQSALHYAVRFNHLNIVQALLKYDADVNAPDNEGNTPLHLTAYRTEGNRRSDLEKIVKLLIESGADVNAKDQAYCTPFDIALYHSQSISIAHLLVKNGAKIYYKPQEKNRCLKHFFSEETQKHELLRSLLAAKDTLNLEQIRELIKDEHTPQYDKQTAVKELLDYQAIKKPEDLQELCSHIIFNHRFFEDETFKPLCDLATFAEVKDKDDEGTLQKVELFCSDEGRTTEIKDNYGLHAQEERIGFMTQYKKDQGISQEHNINLQDKELKIPNFLLP